MGQLSTTARAVIFSLLLAATVLYGGVAHAIELPFDHPASGTEILCYMNGQEEIDGVPVVRPPIPTFDVGTCAEATPPPPAEEPDEPSEENPSPLPQCSNGTDDDGDGLTDSADPGCHTDFNADNPASYDPNGNNEAATITQCSDGLDNDGDGQTDMADPGCSSASDNDETNSSGGGGGGGGGGKKSSATSTGIVLGFSTTTESCDRYLTAFIREGNDNDEDQVKRLQRFLRDFEGAQVEENGIYDAPTLAAVHAFQSKYAADILTPWGATESTGYVYLTTRKKVNEIFCRFTKTFFLTVDELAKIEAVRSAALGLPSAPLAPRPATSPTPAPTPANTAAVGTSGAPVLQGVFDFLQGVWQQYR